MLIRWAPALGLVDEPDPRKVHCHPTPRAGGLAIAGGLAAGLAVCVMYYVNVDLSDPRWVFGLAILLLGLIDDRFSLPWQFRLLAQFGLVAAAVLTGIPLSSTALPPWLLTTLAIFWTVGLVNAFNMLDNMDLLSAGTAWIAVLGLAVLPFVSDSPMSPTPCLLLLGAVSGFLLFNLPPARLFMGDSGSTFLGFFLGLSTVQLVVSSPQPGWHWGVPLCLLALPWYDLLTVVTLRLSQG